GWIADVLRLVAWLPLIYLIFAELENAVTAGFVFARWPFWLVQGASSLKLLFVTLTAIPVLVSFVPRARGGPLSQQPRPMLPTLWALRIPATVLGGVVLVLTQLPA